MQDSLKLRRVKMRTKRGKNRSQTRAKVTSAEERKVAMHGPGYAKRRGRRMRRE